MKNSRFIASLVFLLALPFFSFSQEIDSEKKQKIVALADNVIQLYQRYARFTEDGGEYKFQIKKDFKTLFESNSKIHNDLEDLKDDKFIGFDDYADLVSDYMRETGVEFDIESYKIEESSIQYEELDEMYNVVVSATKKLYNGLTNNKVVNYPKGRRVKLLIAIRVNPERETARIFGISLDKSNVGVVASLAEPVRLQAAPMETYLGISGILSFNNYRYSGTIEEISTATIGLKNKSNLSFGGGVSLLLNPLTELAPNIFVNVGLEFKAYSFSTSINDYNYTTFDRNDFGIDRDKLVEFKDLKEQTSLGVLELPIGVSYKVIDKLDYLIFADVFIKGILPISANGRTSGIVTYTGMETSQSLGIDIGDPLMETGGDNPDQFHTDNGYLDFESDQTTTYQTQFTTAAGVGVNFLYTLTSGSFVGVKLRYSTWLGSVFPQQRDKESFYFKDGNKRQDDGNYTINNQTSLNSMSQNYQDAFGISPLELLFTYTMRF